MGKLEMLDNGRAPMLQSSRFVHAENRASNAGESADSALREAGRAAIFFLGLDPNANPEQRKP
jgi:hypothetical protein